MPRFKVGDWVQPTLETLEYADDEDGDYPPEIHDYPFLIMAVDPDVEMEVDEFTTDDYSVYTLAGLPIGLYDFEVEAVR